MHPTAHPLRVLILASLLSPAACAHARAEDGPAAPAAAEQARRMQEEHARLRKKIAHLEDRIAMLERGGGGTEGPSGLPVVRLAPPRPAPRSAPPAQDPEVPDKSVRLFRRPMTLSRGDEGEIVPGDDPPHSVLAASPPPAGSPPAASVPTSSPSSASPAAAPPAKGGAGEDGPGARRSFRLQGSRLVELTRTHQPEPAPARKARRRGKRHKDPVLAAYDAAMGDLRAGRHAEARRAFARIVQRHPRHDYADNALYWKGEAAYDAGDYQGALEDFTAVVERYGGGNKAPDALLKIGLCYHRLGDQANAVDVLTELIAAYPRARASDVARIKLVEIKG